MAVNPRGEGQAITSPFALPPNLGQRFRLACLDADEVGVAAGAIIRRDVFGADEGEATERASHIETFI